MNYARGIYNEINLQEYHGTLPSNPQIKFRKFVKNLGRRDNGLELLVINSKYLFSSTDDNDTALDKGIAIHVAIRALIEDYEKNPEVTRGFVQ